MMTVAKRRTRPQESGGFTLIELTIVIAILLLVVATILTQLVSAQRSEVFAQDRGAALDETRASMARMTKDLRQATAIDPTSSATNVTMSTYVGGTLTTVAYTISGTNLLRTVSTHPAETLQRDLASTSIFTYEPSSTSAQVVSILLEVQPEHSPETTVQMTSEVRLRNIDTG
jgi:prepilin-type N-terminal cleavage/methylation domain-containing protein